MGFMKYLYEHCKNPKRDLEIYRMRFGLDGHEPHTLKELAKIFRLSPDRIRVIALKVRKGDV